MSIEQILRLDIKDGRLVDEGHVLTCPTIWPEPSPVGRFWAWLERNDYDQRSHYLRYGLSGGYVSEAMHTAHGVARELEDGQRVLFVDIVDYQERRPVASLLLV